jgi:hypothetical protein
VLGVAIGQAMKDGSVMGWVLSLPILIIGWLSILVCIMLWRAACEFFLAIMSIAEDLSFLRQFQEKLDAPQTAAAPQPRAQAEYDVPLPETEAAAAPAQAPTVEGGEPNILEDPFFRPRFERRDI